MNKKKRTRTVWNRAKFLENVGGLLVILMVVWVFGSLVQTSATNLNLDPNVTREPVWWNLIDLFLKYAPKNF